MPLEESTTDAHPDAATPRVAVIGGGITGLAAAHRVLELAGNTAVELTLYESSNRCGGVFGTRRRGDYVIETGADMFITDKPWAVDLCQRLGLADRLIRTDDQHRGSLILRHGKPVPTPEGFSLLVPGKLWPMITTPLLSPLGKLRVGLEYFIGRRTATDDESLAAFVRRRFGREAFDRIVQPMVGGIYTADPELLSLAATLPRFIAMEQEHGSLLRGMLRKRNAAGPDDRAASGARYGLFVSLADGLSELLDALAERVRGRGALRLSCPVVSVTPLPTASRPRYRLALADGTQCDADAVIMALPAYRTADLIDAWQPELAGVLREIEYASAAVVVTGHRRADVDHPLNAFGLVVPQLEGRRILAVSVLSRKFPHRAPARSVLLRTFVGGALQPELLEQSDADLSHMVLDELRDIFGVHGTPELCEVVRYHRAMPQYHVGHLDRVERIELLASAVPRLALAGNAYHGVGIPDCIHSGETAAEHIWSQLRPSCST